MTAPSRAVGRRRRLLLVYTPVFAFGALAALLRGTTAPNGGWLGGCLLMTVAVFAVLIEIGEIFAMTEQPAETVLEQQHPFIPPAWQTHYGTPALADTPQGRDSRVVAANDAAQDAYDKAGEALDSGELERAHDWALRLVSRIRELRIAMEASS